MRSAIMLKVSSVIALLQFVTHTGMFVTYHPSHGPAEVALTASMRDNVFLFSGVPRSYWDMYFGYGLFSAFACLLEAAVLWVVARMASDGSRYAVVLTALFLSANLVYAGLIAAYFFPLPGYFDWVIAVLLAYALVRLFRERNVSLPA